MKNDSGHCSRRSFVKASATTVASLSALSVGLSSGAYAAGSGRVRIGALGCGGRGSGAIINCLQADDGVELVAIADAYQDRIDTGVEKIRRWCEKNSKPARERVKVTPETTFLGFNGYKKLLALKDVDLVLIATPACFHPVHLEAAIQAGKHAFMEKPAAVDPPGARKIIEAGELARQKGLAMVAGTQRRHQAK